MRRALASLALGGLLLACGCVNESYRWLEVDLRADFAVDPAFEDGGNVHVQTHLAVTNPGGGVLSHPLGEIDRFELLEGARSFEGRVEVPLHRGEGLVVYAWLDLDGDGLLCAPGAEPEPAGIAEVEDLSRFEARLTLELSEPCRGPEALYP